MLFSFFTAFQVVLTNGKYVSQVGVVYASDGTGEGISGSQTKTTLKYTPDASRSHIEGSAKSYASTEENVNGKGISEPAEQQVITEHKGAAKIHDFCFGIPFGECASVSVKNM